MDLRRRPRLSCCLQCDPVTTSSSQANCSVHGQHGYMMIERQASNLSDLPCLAHKLVLYQACDSRKARLTGLDALN